MIIPAFSKTYGQKKVLDFPVCRKDICQNL